MRCKFCSAPLPQKGLVCSYCGQRNPLNLNVLSKIDIEEKKSDYNCPVCNVLMENINIGIKTKVLVQRCDKCDGIFILEDILEQLLQSKSLIKKDIDLHMLRFIQDNPRHKQENIISYRKCPVCDKTMQRINYKTVSGVVVDRCLRHGVWLDGGELRQLFEWKKVGGEIKVREEKPIVVKKPETIFNKSQEEPLFDPVGNFLNWLQGG